MTALVELSFDEVAAYAVTIAAAETKEAFVAAFTVYVKDVIARESDPYEKIALFVHGMVGGQREMIAALVQWRGGGAA